ncbi:hypothetical protein ACFL1H_01090 [Nanoarchaeota archaeon]
MGKRNNFTGITDTIEFYFNELGIKQTEMKPAIFEDDIFRYRLLDDEVQISVKAHFDRWANSVDFFYPALPQDKIGVEAIILAAKAQYDNKEYNPGLAEDLDLSPFYRKYRRIAKNKINV